MDLSSEPISISAVRLGRRGVLSVFWRSCGAVGLAALFLPLFFTQIPVVALGCWVGYAWIVIFGVRFLCEAIAGDAKGAWVPSTASLLVAVALLALVALVRLPRMTSEFRPDYSIAVLLLQLVALGMMVLHARASGRRMRSLLFGWATCVPLALGLGRLHPLQPIPVILSSARGMRESTNTILFAFAVVLGGWWIVVSFLEALILRLESRSDRKQKGSVAQLPVGLPLAALPMLAFALPFSAAVVHFVRPYVIDLVARSSFNWPAALLSGFQYDLIYYLLASIIVAGMGLFLSVGLSTLVADPRVRSRTRSAAWMGAAFAVGIGCFPEGIQRTSPVFLALSYLCILVMADAVACRVAASSVSGSTPSVEAIVLRTLVEFPRSSMRWWGSGRRRWVFYLGPVVLLALIPALCLGAIMFSYRIRRGIFTASPIELLRIPANRYGWYSMILVFSAVAGIVIPLAVLIPERIAARFQRLWNPEGLSDIVLTRLTAWEILVGIIVPPIKGLLFLIALAIPWVGFLWIQFGGAPVGIVQHFSQLGATAPAVVYFALILALFVPVAVTSASLKGRIKGVPAVLLSWGVAVLLFLCAVAITRYVSNFSEFVFFHLLLPYLTMVCLATIRSLRDAPRRLEAVFNA